MSTEQVEMQLPVNVGISIQKNGPTLTVVIHFGTPLASYAIGLPEDYAKELGQGLTGMINDALRQYRKDGIVVASSDALTVLDGKKLTHK